MTEPMADPEASEAYKTLIDRVGRKSPKIPPGLLVRHVLATVPEAEWPTRVEAIDVLLRRLDAVKKDGLKIDGRPRNGRVLGVYATRRRESAARPYRTALGGIDPIEARCDCPDFLKNSLGACKHILTIIEHIYDRPRLLVKARKERESRAGSFLEGRAGTRSGR